MDLDKIMMWTRAERRGVADFLDDLHDHVAAHDVATRLSAPPERHLL
ncbi:hypothetical protein [Nocardia abscessus]|nr:hypothetical protein [Nocardia abscessus]